MKLAEARVWGEVCGLTTDHEAVNNALLHLSGFVPYTDLAQELNELISDAEAHGVRFSRSCGDALAPDDDEEDDVCYMCKNINNLVESVTADARPTKASASKRRRKEKPS